MCAVNVRLLISEQVFTLEKSQQSSAFFRCYPRSKKLAFRNCLSSKGYNVNKRILRFIFANYLASFLSLKSNSTSLCNKRIENLLMHDLRGNYILNLKQPVMVLVLFGTYQLSCEMRYLIFIRTTEFTGFKRESRVAFCTEAFLVN